ncbi:uncharacterized protein LOC111023163 [Momordica charantia]|uniref:Uncharacterized protein LOC111023163 n=1 Tax=Momordica charantia TaxID=3673 RepID=A0A6J1DQ19_MOMCH|nr:uncharacterized protein LOC111023163 [Momordica charantia]
MCRSTDYQRFPGRLKIKAFFVRFSRPESLKPPPESLTLLYLPRIDEIDGAKIRPDSAALVALQRVVWRKDAVIFGSRERVRASEGARFEVYLREEKVVEGTFRRSEEGEWRLECKGALGGEFAGAAAAEICVDVEEQGAMFEKVVLGVRRMKKRGFSGLEEIPEEREGEVEEADSDGCGDSSEEDDDGCGGDGRENEVEMEVEGVRWAVNLGIWAVCLGVGLLVSKAAHSKKLRPKRII